MSKILVSGSLAYDRIINFDGVFPEPFAPEDLKHLIKDFPVGQVRETFGGNAGNIAYNLALLGEEPDIIAVAGNDFGRYREWLQKNGIGEDTIQIEQDLPTANANIVTDTHDNQITEFNEEALARPYTKEIRRGAALAILSPNHMDLMTSLPKTYAALRIPYYFDPGQRTVRMSGEGLRAGIAGARALFVNQHEFQLVVEKTGWDEKEILDHVPAVVITRGEEGARILTPDGETRVSAVKVAHAVDPTGAGDAHRAGFLKAALLGHRLRECARLASVIASFAVEHHGTQNHSFTLPEVQERYQRAYGELVPLSIYS
jgi:adenosine kinase